MSDENTSPPYFSSDVVLEILVRLPPSSRRRFRLVCKSWRDAVDTHTTEMKSRAKPLVATTGLAYIVNDMSAPGMSSLLWKDGSTAHGDKAGTSVIGTCNGLICLCDNRESGGAITLINPVTGETLAIPRLPCAPGPASCCWHETYSFGYHPTTGRYKVVHVPCSYDSARAFRSVQVFTLGESSWRDVVTPPAAICNRSAGVVSVDGATYWSVNGTEKIMRLDLGDERFTPIQPIPAEPSGCRSWHLTEVKGKLGIVFAQSSRVPYSKTEVWVLEDVKTGEPRWSCGYVELDKDLTLTRPHFAHGKHHLLTQELAHDGYGRQFYAVYGHNPSEHARKRWRGEAEADISDQRRGTMIASTYAYGRPCDRRTFSYVGTTEPLAAYMPC